MKTYLLQKENVLLPQADVLCVTEDVTIINKAVSAQQKFDNNHDQLALVVWEKGECIMKCFGLNEILKMIQSELNLQNVEKCSEEDMRQELEQNNIVDNPIDVIKYHLSNMAKSTLRMIDSTELSLLDKGNARNFIREIRDCTTMIADEIRRTLNLSGDTINMCIETSYNLQKDKIDDMYNSISEYQKCFEVRANRKREIPCRHYVFERIRLGETSDDYKKIVKLRRIVDDMFDESLTVMTDLYSMEGIIEYGVVNYRTTVNPNITDDSAIYCKMMVDRYALCLDDILYMIAYGKTKERG